MVTMHSEQKFDYIPVGQCFAITMHSSRIYRWSLLHLYDKFRAEVRLYTIGESPTVTVHSQREFDCTIGESPAVTVHSQREFDCTIGESPAVTVHSQRKLDESFMVTMHSEQEFDQ